LLGVTLGTGLGGGIVRNGELFTGDNSIAGELWLLRNKLLPEMNAEEGASIRAVRRAYAECAGVAFAEAPEPKEIHEIAVNKWPGDKSAAVEAFRRLGETVGDVIGNALTLVDGLVVIGGGLSKAAPLFLPALMAELNSEYSLLAGKRVRRLASQAFNLEDPKQLSAFLKGSVREIEVPKVSMLPGKIRTLKYDPLRRVGVGLSRLGTSEAVAVGAYAFALQRLVEAKHPCCQEPQGIHSQLIVDRFQRGVWLRELGGGGKISRRARRRIQAQIQKCRRRKNHRARQIFHRQPGTRVDVRELFSEHARHNGGL
jgi:glucokinase